MYGSTPMREALSLSLDVFRKQPNAERRVLVLISDGDSADGDPVPIARKLQQASITLAAIYLTSNRGATRRRLYDRAAEGWNVGQRALFDIVAKVACAAHPIPVLASMGWDVPSSGECALYAAVCSAKHLTNSAHCYCPRALDQQTHCWTSSAVCRSRIVQEKWYMRRGKQDELSELK
jgi:hypothetical protein